MRRISIVGNSGSGKTTLAGQLAERLGLTHIELDALFHQPNWEPTPPAAFQAKVRAAMDAADEATDGWTMCGNYGTASNGIAQDAADTIVWLDLPRSLLMRRVSARTLRRALTRQELWNGNREPLTNFTSWDPQKNIIRWTWTEFDRYREKFNLAMTDGTWAHAEVHHLRTPADVAAFLASAT